MRFLFKTSYDQDLRLFRHSGQVFWYGLLAPAKTPRAIVTRLNREITGILNQPDVRSRWVSLGAEPAPTTPAQFDKLIAEDIAALTKLARASNIKAD